MEVEFKFHIDESQLAALQAAAQPAETRALYFVARGDGSSEFSETLDAHNRAVDKYIRGK